MLLKYLVIYDGQMDEWPKSEEIQPSLEKWMKRFISVTFLKKKTFKSSTSNKYLKFLFQLSLTLKCDDDKVQSSFC